MIPVLLLIMSVLLVCGITVSYLAVPTAKEPLAKRTIIRYEVPPPATQAETVATVHDCSESSGLVRVLTADGGGSNPRWACTNYTGYTDSNGRKVGGNCDGPVSYNGRIECECMAVVDPVTKKRRPTTRIDVQSVQLCVPDVDLFEAN